MVGVVPACLAFFSEKALIVPQGSWALATINQQDPKFEVGMFAFPGEEVGKEVTVDFAEWHYQLHLPNIENRKIYQL